MDYTISTFQKSRGARPPSLNATLVMWKNHMITPVFKSGNRSSVTNYRPISLLCVTPKVLEKLVNQNIIKILRPQFSPHQFGFSSNRSCLHKLLIFVSNVIQAINSKSQLDTIFLDLKSPGLCWP